MRTVTVSALRSFVLRPCICIVAMIAIGIPGISKAAEKASEQVSPFVGSFSTGVPIEVPGFHSLEPRMALGYSSEGRNGRVGVGWGLSGFSTVQRANPGMGTPRFDSTDIFMLDGQELIPCQPSIVSPSCTSGGTHTTKIESYVKIRFDSSANQWSVWGKDGTRTILTAIYDVPPDYLVIGGTLRWGQASVVDTKGNTVAYNWASQDGDVYPDSVEYNGYRVKIYRESRPDAQSFAAASLLGHTRYRIRSVLVQVTSGAAIRAYKLTYTTSAVTGRSLLSSVQEYGKDVAIDATGLITAGTTLPARTFAYQNDSLGKTFQAWEGTPSPANTIEPVTWAKRVNTQATGSGNSLTRVANGQNPWDAGGSSTRAIVSGDGYLEFTVRFDGSKMAGLSNGDTDTSPNDIDFAWFENGGGGVGWAYWWENGTYQEPPYGISEGDKLRVEVTAGVVRYKINGVTVHTSTKTPTYPLLVDTSFNGIGATINDAYISGALQDGTAWCQGAVGQGDFNGDGRTDQVCYTGFSTDVKVRLMTVMTATGFAPPTTWLTGFGWDRPVFGDFNSDGKTDFGMYAGWEGQFFVGLSTGTGFATPTLWGAAAAIDPWDGQLHACRMDPAFAGTGDFNGDGRVDVYCRTVTDDRIFVGLSNGSSFTFSVFNHLSCDTWDATAGAIDFDGDGKDDWYCIGAENSRLHIFPSDGTNFYPTSLGSLDSTFCDSGGYVLGDLNGDGRADAACMSNGNVALSRGRGFSLAGTFGGWCSGSTNFFASDVDGDGASELICNNTGAGADDIQVRKWQNDSLSAAETWKANWCTGKVSGGDFSGDGKTDLLCDSQGAPAVAGTGGFVSDLMATAANGLGGTTQLAYTPSTSFQNTNNPPPKFTVTSLTTLDGRGGSSTATYTYSGGLMDRFERRFLGFRQVRNTLPCIVGETACPYVDTWLKQDLASAGKPERVEYHDGAGQLLRASESQYTTNGTTVPRVSLLTGQFAYTYSGGACPSWPCATGKRTYTSYTYDAFGNPTTTTSWGDYDNTGDEVTVERIYSPNTAAYIVGLVAIERTPDPQGGFLTRTQHWYDGATTASQPPTQGYPTATRRWLKAEGRWVTRSMAYDNWGNMTSATDETGRATTTTYDGTYHIFPTSVTNPAQETDSAVWDPICGVPTQQTDPNNQLSTFQYDNLCRLTRTDLPLGAYEMRDYLDLGDPNLQRTWVRTPPALTGTGKQYVMDYFDGLGRTYRSIAKGPAANQRIFSDTTYNPRGQVAGKSAPYYETESPQNSVYSYDQMDRLTATTLPDGHQVTKSYGLWSETTSDEHGHPSTATYDAYGRALTQDNWHSGQQVRTQFSYDILGQLVGTQDALGNAWSWTFDSLGRNVQKSDPDAGIGSFEYDDAGRVKAQVDAKSQRIELGYDLAGRLLTKTPVGVPSEAVTMTYGQTRTGFFNVGLLTSVTYKAGLPDSSVQKTDYDALGRPVKQVQTLGGIDYTVERRYDAGGRLRGITYPDGDAVGTTENPLGYDQAGRLTAIPGIVTEVLYDAAGRPTRQANFNGTLTERGYSVRGFLTGIRTAGPALIQDLTYSSDAAGLLQQVTSSLPNVPNESWSYTYDDLHRLTYATDLSNPNESQTWSLDVLGRITYNSRVGSYTYPGAGAPRPHAPSSVAGNPYTYDDNGNLTSGGGRTPQWNVYNKPIAISGTQFVYDGLGERVKKTSAQGTSLYPMGDDYEVTNGVVTKYVSVAGLGVVAKRVGSQTFWMHTDRLGSIQAITNDAGAQVWRKTYRPYGETITESTSHQESRGWIDQRQDKETGLTYLHARYYDPALGVFLSPDPLPPSTPGVGTNRYGYGFDNPLNGTDRSGLMMADVFWDFCFWAPCYRFSDPTTVHGEVPPIVPIVVWEPWPRVPPPPSREGRGGNGGGGGGKPPDTPPTPPTPPTTPPKDPDMKDDVEVVFDDSKSDGAVGAATGTALGLSAAEAGASATGPVAWVLAFDVGIVVYDATIFSAALGGRYHFVPIRRRIQPPPRPSGGRAW